MKYQKLDGTFSPKPYPQSFGAEDLDALAAFLDSGQTFTLQESGAGAPPSAICIRHDVDHNLEHALKFARWEHDHGYRASYFVLPGAWYAAEPEYEEQLRELIALGHEVGLHSNVVGIAHAEGALHAVDGSALPLGFCERPAEIMREQLAHLRALGLDVVGSAAHGNGIEGASNLDLWAAGYRPKDFGLRYEAYHLHRFAHYISDNRGKWSEPLALDTEKATHILIHPCHWNV